MPLAEGVKGALDDRVQGAVGRDVPGAGGLLWWGRGRVRTLRSRRPNGPRWSRRGGAAVLGLPADEVFGVGEVPFFVRAE